MNNILDVLHYIIKFQNSSFLNKTLFLSEDKPKVQREPSQKNKKLCEQVQNEKN